MAQSDGSQVKAVFSRQGTPRKIYVEAATLQEVKHLMTGLYGVSKAQTAYRKVEIHDLPYLLDMDMPHDKFPKTQGSWVCITRGPYKGDIGLVSNINFQNKTAEVFVVPRIEMKPKGKRSRRPPPLLFNPKAVAEVYGSNACDKRNAVYLFKGNVYNEGFRELSLDITHTISTSPTHEQKQIFCPFENLWKATETNVTPGFHTGDPIWFTCGPWKQHEGKVVGIQGDSVHFTNDLLGGEVYQGLVKDACKKFQLGDFVEVQIGEHKGAIGYIVQFDGRNAILYARTVLIIAERWTHDIEGTEVSL